MPELMTTAEVLELFKISEPTLYRLLRGGDFPKPQVKVGRQNRWTRGQLDQWIKSGGQVLKPLGRPRGSSRPKPAPMRCPPRRQTEAARQQS